MTAERFMDGDEAAMFEEPAPVMTVLLIGYQGQLRLLTGVRSALWNEFMRGDGGYGCNGVRPIGWEYWVEQTLGTNDLAHATVPPSIAPILKLKGK